MNLSFFHFYTFFYIGVEQMKYKNFLEVWKGIKVLHTTKKYRTKNVLEKAVNSISK